jgi:hypothetical protein
MQALTYNDLSADRNVVAIVQALEAILERHVADEPGCSAHINAPEGGLVLRRPGRAEGVVLYAEEV